jgi:hypothetical protein
VKQTKIRCLLLLLLMVAVRSGAQEHNAVPLNHTVYDIIEMGVMRGVILPPPVAKPWSLRIVKQKLWEMMHDPAQILSSQEMETVASALDSFDRIKGFDFKNGRYRTEGVNYTFETGFGWESVFSVGVFDPSLASINMAEVYTGGDISRSFSWNITALGEFLYIERKDHAIHSVFSYPFTKQWDGGVLSLRKPQTYVGWPDDPALAYGMEGEINGVFFDQRLQLRLGRLRHDWGHELNGTTLFLNAHSRPFTALEGTFSPLSWMNISVLNGALEHFREDQWPKEGPFSGMLTAAQIEFNPFLYLHANMGGALVVSRGSVSPLGTAPSADITPNMAFFVDLKFRLPGLLTIWGGIFVDRLDSSAEDFLSTNGNSYAFQAGIKSIVHWLPFAAFTLRYTKVEPYCYSSFTSGGESLGYYLPPNSDELFIRLESMLFPDIKAHVQFQMIRSGVAYDYGAVAGSSWYDKLADTRSSKYFLNDGVYQWNHILKLGGSFNLKAGGIPLLVFAETGLALTSFTINGTAGAGNEAEFELLDDPEHYRNVNNFIFSVGFKLFPR